MELKVFTAGSEVFLKRINQGLKPAVRIEAKRWRGYHTVLIKARIERDDEWIDVAATTGPVSHARSRQWDSTALALWEELTGTESRFAYLTQHLSHLMYIFEAEVSDVRLKRDLTD